MWYEKTKLIGLVEEGRLRKFLTGTSLGKDSQKLKGAEAFLKSSDGLFSLSQMKHLRKVRRR